MEILVVAAENSLPLCELFEEEGYSVRAAESEGEALSLLAERPVRLVVLEGSSLCGSLRRKSVRLGSSAPLLVVADGASASEVAAIYEEGADGYLTKPFVPAELMARARALLRRTPTAPRVAGPWRLGSLFVDRQSYEVRCGASQVRLTLSEFKILSLLISHQGMVVGRKQLRDLLPGGDELDRSPSRIVDIHIAGIRKKLGACAGYLETVRGAGYRMKEALD